MATPPLASTTARRRTTAAALTSDHFVRAHRALGTATDDGQPEIVFFAPAAGGSTTAFYTCKIASDGSGSARELVTVGNLRAKDLVVLTKPCNGLTLLFQASSSEYYVCNLSTGEHVSLPPYASAAKPDPYSGGAYVCSSTGLGFDPAAGEHKVVRLYEEKERGQQRCEMYSLVSGGGWRPSAGRVPPDVTKCLEGRPPVFLEGCFYWHMDTGRLGAVEASILRSPEQTILSLSVVTEQFGWIPTPEGLAREVSHLAELDGSLCAVVDLRLVAEEYELWTWSGAGAGAAPAASSSSWSRRCRISLTSLERPMRDELGLGLRVLPLCTSPDGKILLATSWHKVYAYGAGSNRVNTVFSMHHLVDVPVEPALMLNIALHEESVVVVGRRGDVGRRLKMEVGKSGVVI
uniref:F-box associated beta-propeller type 3 domain-containing protein n=1 Tax=Oryza punctata TaxID=4537 RepID=A0A0E0M9I3_ORYPU